MGKKIVGMAGKVAGPQGSWRRRWSVVLSIVIALGAAMVVKQNVMAVHDLVFELDGDVTTDTNIDWDQIFTAAGEPVTQLPAGFDSAGFEVDFQTQTVKGTLQFASADTTTYATGSKDTLPISTGQQTWQCAQSNNVTDKDDIMNAYAAFYVDPATGDEILYFGMERNANNGDANFGFWFLQGDVSCVSPGGATTFSGTHEDGDLFIVSAFSNGGTVSTITVYRWDGDDTGGLNPVPVASGVDCREPSTPAGDSACGAANTEGITLPWQTSEKTDGVGNSLRTAEFFEGGLNLTQTNLGGKCFNTFVGNTRSSTSLTATIFDYAMGTLGVCGSTLATDVKLANADLAANATIAPGVAVHDVATVTITGADEPDDATGSVDFFYCFNATQIPDCSTGGTAAGADIALADTSSPANLTDGISGASSTEINTAGSPLAAGFYCFRAEFTLTNYDNPDPNTHTNTTTECFQVQDTSTTSTAQDWLPNDTATVTATAGSNLSGTVVFTLYTGSDCNAGNDDTQLYTETVTLTNAASPAIVSTTNTATLVTTTGTVSWKAVYSGSAAVTGSNHCQTTTLTITN